jgi:hypothetical protein
MKVIPPISITSSMFTSTVSEPSAGETAWVSGSGYAVGARVIRTSTHRVYECIATVTAASAASTTTPEASVTSITPYWADAGPTNKYAMFDLYRNSATVPGTTAMSVVCTPGQRIDSVAIMGMSNVQQIRISATSVSGGGSVYDTGYVSLNKRNTVGWYTYFFSRIRYADIFVKFDLPPYTDIIVTIEFIGASNMYVGGVILGMSEWLGYIQRKPSLDTLNFSKVERDAFGNATMVPRRNVPKTNQTLFLENTYLSRVLEVKESLNAVPALWCGVDDIGDSPYFEQLMIVGFYRTFSVDIDNPLGVFITLELEEL